VLVLRLQHADGLVDLDGPTVRVRPQGRALVRAVAAVFDRYLEDDAGAPKHAVAV
jgi:coproporphyrinogen III oxidase-like Fe-S oxidoreductase